MRGFVHAQAVAQKQHGAITFAQAIKAGMTDDSAFAATKSGLLIPEHHGVYRLGGVPVTWQMKVMMATLAGGDFVVASHRTAAALWRLPDFPQGSIHVTVPYEKKYVAKGVFAHRGRKLSTADRTTVDGIPVTNISCTLVHLAGCVSYEQLQDAVDEAIRSDLTTPRRLLARLAVLGGRGVAGTTVLREILDEYRPGEKVPASVFERRLLRVVIAALLPRPIIRYEVQTRDGLIEVDAAWPDEKVCVEANSKRFHDTQRRVLRDEERRALLAGAGWRIVPVRWFHLKRVPDRVVRDLRDALDHR